MRSLTEKPESIDQYIALAGKPVQPLLKRVRKVIRAAAPEAEEAIRYGMPTFILNGNLVHFAACEQHLGFYPTPSAIVRFAAELKPWVTSKGAVQFPYDLPLPLDLIRSMVEFRVAENLAKPPRRKTSGKVAAAKRVPVSSSGKQARKAPIKTKPPA